MHSVINGFRVLNPRLDYTKQKQKHLRSVFYSVGLCQGPCTASRPYIALLDINYYQDVVKW